MLEYYPVVRTSYRIAGAVQEKLSRRLLDAKKAVEASDLPAGYLLGFEFNPVYTNGRRQAGHFSDNQIKHFQAEGKAEFVETLRGGHTTFHGPGQLVLYPVVDLKRLNLKVRDYVCSLEKGIVEVLASKYNLKSAQTKSGENGVWLDRNRKIASLGIHVRRNVTTHGISVNVNLDPFWFSRIVACNLPDAKLVSMADQGVLGDNFTGSVSEVGRDISLELARRWNTGIYEHTPEESKELVRQSAKNDTASSIGVQKGV